MNLQPIAKAAEHISEAIKHQSDNEFWSEILIAAPAISFLFLILGIGLFILHKMAKQS